MNRFITGKILYGMAILLCLALCGMPSPGFGARITGEEVKEAAPAVKQKIVGSKSTRQYYLPTMALYAAIKGDDRVEFDSEEQALKSGYRRAEDIPAISSSAGQASKSASVSDTAPSTKAVPSAPASANSSTVAATAAAKTMIPASPAIPPAQPEKGDVAAAKAPTGGTMPQGRSPEPFTLTKTPSPAVTKAVAPHPAAHSKSHKEPRYVTIDFDNVDIAVFVKFVSELSGKNFVIDEKVKGKVTVISPKKISLDEVYKVFLSVLEVNGFATVPAGDVIKIVPAMEVRGKGVETHLNEEVKSPEDKIVTQIISLDYANPDEMKKILEPLMSKTSIVLSYPPTGMLIVTDVLSNIKRLQAIINALDAEGVGEQISYIPLKSSSASEVAKSLTAIFQQQKGIAPIRIVAEDRTNAILLLASEADTNRIKDLVTMMDKGISKGSMMNLYRLQNANAEDLAKVLTNLPKTGATATAAQGQKLTMFSKEVSILADKATNTLIITADRADYLLLESVIKQLDTPRPMVYIEALIMEVGMTKDFNLGVEWRFVRDSSDASISVFGKTVQGAVVGSFAGGSTLFPTLNSTGTAITNFPAGGFSVGVLGTGITIGNIVFPTIGAMVQALDNTSDISILSTPQLLTLDNEDAEINVGENVPYVTRQDQTNTGPLATTNYSSYDYKDVGVMLKINPHISEDNYIRLKLDQQLTKIKGTQTTTPTTLKRAAKTTIVVKDGETVVIGGLIDDSTSSATYKIPLLGDIPFLGWLFKYKSNSRAKTNLFTFITPHIIRNQKEAADLYKRKIDDAGKLEAGVVKMYEKKPMKTNESPVKTGMDTPQKQ